MKRICFPLLLAGLLAWVPEPNAADGRLGFLLPERLGIRGGFSMDSDTKQFHQAELAAGYSLPWGWEAKKLKLESGIDTSAGWLWDDTKEAFILSAGPEARLRYASIPVALRFGSNPTYISRYAFDQRDFGVEIQFVSHVGLSWDIAEHLQLSYRLQHMSNSGIASPNPGLNMHMFALHWLF